MALDYPVASDLSYECLQLRRSRGELRTPELNESNRRLHAPGERKVTRGITNALPGWFTDVDRRDDGRKE